MLVNITGEVFSGAFTNVQDSARLDITADGFWGGQYEKIFFDVWVFHPYVPSNQQSQLETFTVNMKERRKILWTAYS